MVSQFQLTKWEEFFGLKSRLKKGFCKRRGFCEGWNKHTVAQKWLLTDEMHRRFYIRVPLEYMSAPTYSSSLCESHVGWLLELRLDLLPVCHQHLSDDSIQINNHVFKTLNQLYALLFYILCAFSI